MFTRLFPLVVPVPTFRSRFPRILLTPTNRHLRGKGERNGIQRRIKVSFGRTMMQALELLWLTKRHVFG